MSAPRGSLQPEAPKRVVEETRRLYASLLSKPLDQRQLARPNFKLVQEIVKNLITETRMLRQEFNASDFEQANSRVSWDKRKRCDFLQRLIDFVAINKQPVVGCVPAKLVAGLEPTKCNELLQALARIATSRKQDNAKTRTFTKSDLQGSRRARETSASRPDAPQSRASSRHSSATRKPSKPDLMGAATTLSASKKSTRRVSNAIAGETTRDNSPSNGTQAGQVAAKVELEQANETSEREELAKSRLKSSANESGARAPVTSESDISKGVHSLRSELRAFQRVLSDIEQLETELRSKLQQAK